MALLQTTLVFLLPMVFSGAEGLVFTAGAGKKGEKITTLEFFFFISTEYVIIYKLKLFYFWDILTP